MGLRHNIFLTRKYMICVLYTVLRTSEESAERHQTLSWDLEMALIHEAAGFILVHCHSLIPRFGKVWPGNETSNAVLQLVSVQREIEPTAVRWLVLS